MTPRLAKALDALETANIELVEARKAETAPPAPAKAKANVKDKIVSGVKHVFNPANVAALKQPAAVPAALPAKTVAPPIKSAPAAKPAAKVVQKPASVPQMVTRTPSAQPKPHWHRHKMAGM